MELETGKTYLAHQPAYSFVFEGILNEFDEVNFEFTVLGKPRRVIADDGVEQTIIKLPKHLVQPNWYWIHNHTKDINHWFNVSVYEVKPLVGELE